MIQRLSPLCIAQDLVGDCSFVASLCICAAFEKRWRRRLITGIVHPQDPKSGTPVYNPCGKYVVKLWANGCPRRVVVDDRLPCDRNGSLMTCYSNDRKELWVSIIEKAYMKVVGSCDL
jgi:calpain-7